MVFKKIGGKRTFHREMVHGHWKCTECGGEITELPFHPSPDRPIYCKDCWAKKRAEKFGK